MQGHCTRCGFTSIRDQCKAAGVPFFFKQWGEWAPRYDGWFTLPSGKDLATVDPECKKWPHVIRLTESGHNGRDLEHVDGGEDVFMQRIGKKQAGCPFCTNDQFYVYTRVSGITGTHYGFNGEDADNTHIHDYLSYTDQKTAYCTSCHKKIGMAKDCEEPRWDTNKTQGAHHE